MAYILDGLILAVIGVALDRSRWRKARRDPPHFVLADVREWAAGRA